MYCRECGEYIEEDSTFCHMCGAKQIHDENQANQTYEKKPKKTIVSDVARTVVSSIAQECIEQIVDAALSKASKTAKKGTHKLLVKTHLKRKNLGDLGVDLKKKIKGKSKKK